METVYFSCIRFSGECRDYLRNYPKLIYKPQDAQKTKINVDIILDHPLLQDQKNSIKISVPGVKKRSM